MQTDIDVMLFKDLAMETADQNKSTIILANDPDADRLALAEKLPKWVNIILCWYWVCDRLMDIIKYCIHSRISRPLADKSRSIFDHVILYSGICSLYKSRSSICLKSLKIRIIVVIREKLTQSFQTHGVSNCVINISMWISLATSHTHTDFTLML